MMSAIFGIGIDIHHGSKIDVHAQHAKLSGNFRTHLFDQIGILDGPKRHGFWKIEGRIQPHPDSPFRIHRNHQGGLGLCLVVVGEAGLPVRPSLKKNQYSKVPRHLQLLLPGK